VTIAKENYNSSVATTISRQSGQIQIAVAIKVCHGNVD
jgi:hypothetical protein